MKKLRKGFTLIELLVVIAIIGILATIIIINVASARGKAVNAKVSSDLSEAARIASVCLAEGGTVIAVPLGVNGGGNICSDTINAPGTWPVLTGKATNGDDWEYSDAGGSNVGGNTTFKTTAVAGAFSFTCTPNGCVKIGTW